MNEILNLALIVAAGLVVFTVYIIVQAAWLWGACRLLNFMTRRSAHDATTLPLPSLYRSLGISLLVTVMMLLVSVVVFAPASVFLKPDWTTINPVMLSLFVTMLLLNLLATAVVFLIMLPTRFSYGFCLAMVYLGFVWTLAGSLRFGMNLASN